MRDYSNMPKMQWEDGNATLAKIKTQLMREEPVILVMPEGFDFSLDATSCGCREEQGLLTYCDPNEAFSMLAKQNGIPGLQQVGDAASTAGLVVDIDPTDGYLVLHD